MALLFEKSATWRWLVYQSKQSPLRMLVVSGGIFATFYGVGKGVQAAQQLYAGDEEGRARELRERLKSDREAQRYASHSRRALASVFAQLHEGERGAGGDGGSGSGDSAAAASGRDATAAPATANEASAGGSGGAAPPSRAASGRSARAAPNADEPERLKLPGVAWHPRAK